MADILDAFGNPLNIGDTVLRAGRQDTDGTVVDVVHPLTDPITLAVYWREFGEEEAKVSNHLSTELNWVREVMV